VKVGLRAQLWTPVLTLVRFSRRARPKSGPSYLKEGEAKTVWDVRDEF